MKKGEVLGMGLLLLSILLLTAALECRLTAQKVKVAAEVRRIEELETEVLGLRQRLYHLDSAQGLQELMPSPASSPVRVSQ
jgi:hypothetical protein